MVLRKVELKVNLGGMLQAYQSIDTSQPNDVFNKYDEKVAFLSILRDIFTKNLEIESDELSGEEKEKILKVIKNRLYTYFIDNAYQVDAIYDLCDAIKSKKNKVVKTEFIHLVNDMIKPNSLIYDPEYGIHRQIKNEAVEHMLSDDKNPNLTTRTYTLEIDDAKFSNLDGLLQFTAESLENLFLGYVTVSRIALSLRILKEHSGIKTFYTAEELYAKTKETGVPLVDYGLQFVQKNHQKLCSLFQEIRKRKMDSGDNSKDIAKKIRKVFTKEEDLKIVISIANHLGDIQREKRIDKYITKVIEYMANTGMLKETDGAPNTLRLDADLSNFEKDYLVATNLKKLASKRKYEVIQKIKEKGEALAKERGKYQQAGDGETEEIMRSINSLKNDIYQLKCAEKKEILAYNNIFELLCSLPFLPILSPAQKKYLFKKTEAFGNSLNIKVVTKETEEQREVDGYIMLEKLKIEETEETKPSSSVLLPRKKGLIGTLLLGGITLIATSALSLKHNYSKNSQRIGDTNTDNLYYAMDSSQLRNMNSHSIS
ncbi:hypothetical protein NEMIN01_2315 [Nematocida minor]|uniref:uncharacterized protein n=1 Tax=Nematocida minor TaxID=1912983 RepID=UPI002220CF12|nr:uncharacterized protein NEMIN01_2315 [Nematocida minor]KAI5192959.1 hypothetical protein NEMIN01_2315 [Nematocida minor]